MRKVAVITGTRAEYGLLRPVMEAIGRHPSLAFSLIVTGMHLAPEYGYTVDEIRRDGFAIDAMVDMLLSNNTRGAMAKSLGVGIMGMSQAFESLRPDIVLVLGDRSEPLAAAVSAACLGIPVAHLHGGEVTLGSLDESMRHAITRFAHIHLTASKESADRIIRTGEEEWRVTVVGAPGLDSLKHGRYLSKTELAGIYGFDSGKEFLVVVQHPETVGEQDTALQMIETLEALVQIGIPSVVIYPNSDPGSRQIIDSIKRYAAYPFLCIHVSLPHMHYLSLLKSAKAIIGNSSSGLIEAPFLKLPAVNIGRRQEGRQRANNVVNAGYDRKEIIAAIQTVLYDGEFRKRLEECVSPYGDGETGPKVAQVLSQIEIDDRLLRKRLTF